MKEHNGELSFNDILICLFANENNIPYLASFDKDFDEIKEIIRIKDKQDLEVGR